MKRTCLVALLACGLVAGTSTKASAALLITEINSDATGGDFWELTNFGSISVDLGGWIWDDDSADPNDPDAVTVPSGISIASGESILFVVGDEATFRSTWNLGESVQVIASADPGLGKNDAINLYDSSQALQLSLSYAAGGFTLSDGSSSLGGHAGSSAGSPDSAWSMIWDPTFGVDSPRYTYATGSNFGSFANTEGEFGSPGLVNAVPEPGTVALVAIGACGVLWRLRRRKAVA